MNLTRQALLVVCALAGATAFSPASYGASPSQMDRIAKEHARFSPVPIGMVDDDDDILNGADEDIDSPPEEDYLVTAGELETEDDDVGLEDDGEPPAWYTSQQRMEELRIKHRRHDKDTGSPEFQVAGMTERIAYLTKHLKQHPKDFSTRRGLVALVNKRRRLLNYLAREDESRYVEVVASLGIRHKAPGRVPDRADVYSRFPGQKAVKKHLQKK
ncbi:protein S15 [Seminavis robusta]|uniref:Protein S15 n=1 Tax=Seminavis robusta TaxID=568900 RepID=A0A9N8D9I5_9STRA|nr:protein S15 [Seminavis robusta]|eukprot:Sro48_g028080.1 protein S15 (215) ;mRNA; f:14059-15286